MLFSLLNHRAMNFDHDHFFPSVSILKITHNAKKIIQNKEPNALYFSQNSSSIQSHNLPPDSTRGSCRECLITGVLTCTGLSGYFLKLATELPDVGAKEATKQVVRHKYFLYCGSVTWAAAGIYRLYLG